MTKEYVLAGCTSRSRVKSIGLLPSTLIMEVQGQLAPEPPELKFCGSCKKDKPTDQFSPKKIDTPKKERLKTCEVFASAPPVTAMLTRRIVQECLASRRKKAAKMKAGAVRVEEDHQEHHKYEQHHQQPRCQQPTTYPFKNE